MYTFNGNEKAIEWMKSKIKEDMKQEQSIINLCIIIFFSFPAN